MRRSASPTARSSCRQRTDRGRTRSSKSAKQPRVAVDRAVDGVRDRSALRRAELDERTAVALGVDRDVGERIGLVVDLELAALVLVTDEDERCLRLPSPLSVFATTRTCVTARVLSRSPNVTVMTADSRPRPRSASGAPVRSQPTSSSLGLEHATEETSSEKNRKKRIVFIDAPVEVLGRSRPSTWRHRAARDADIRSAPAVRSRRGASRTSGPRGP